MGQLRPGGELPLCAKARRGYHRLEESPGQWQGKAQWETWGKDPCGKHTLRVAGEGRGSFWSNGGTVAKIAVLSIQRWLWDPLWDRGDSRSVLPFLSQQVDVPQGQGKRAVHSLGHFLGRWEPRSAVSGSCLSACR